jgi:hypothetical protein
MLKVPAPVSVKLRLTINSTTAHRKPCALKSAVRLDTDFAARHKQKVIQAEGRRSNRAGRTGKGTKIERFSCLV